MDCDGVEGFVCIVEEYLGDWEIPYQIHVFN